MQLHTWTGILIVVAIAMASSISQTTNTPAPSARLSAATPSSEHAAEPGASGTPTNSEEQLYPAEELQWRGGANGVSTAIAEGDPSQAGTFTMMLKLADGAWIPPHFHNVNKRLIVLKGTLLMGTGQVLREDAVKALPTGGVAVVPKTNWHYEGGRGETIVALIAEGPFETTFA